MLSKDGRILYPEDHVLPSLRGQPIPWTAYSCSEDNCPNRATGPGFKCDEHKEAS